MNEQIPQPLTHPPWVLGIIAIIRREFFVLFFLLFIYWQHNTDQDSPQPFPAASSPAAASLGVGEATTDLAVISTTPPHLS